MSNPTDSPEAQPNNATETKESFQDMLSQFEKSHSHKPEEGSKRIEATVVALTADSVLLDIGFKTEGIVALTALRGETVKPGDKLFVTVKGRNPEGYYEVALGKVSRPTDWESLEKAFNEKATIVGTVTAAIKGGLSVDVGVRAFMPASRSGARKSAAASPSLTSLKKT
jgi:small subunit ribosomal protein S1